MRTPRGVGFTLVEMLLVLTLLGILAGLAAPRLDGLVMRMRMRAVLEGFVGDLYFARAVAARSGERVQIRFELRPDGCAARYHLVQVSGPRLLRTVEIGTRAPGVCLGVSGGANLTINSRGMPTGASRTLRVRSAAGGDSLRISLVGRVHRLYAAPLWWVAAIRKIFPKRQQMQRRMR